MQDDVNPGILRMLEDTFSLDAAHLVFYTRPNLQFINVDIDVDINAIF